METSRAAGWLRYADPITGSRHAAVASPVPTAADTSEASALEALDRLDPVERLLEITAAIEAEAR